MSLLSDGENDALVNNVVKQFSMGGDKLYKVLVAAHNNFKKGLKKSENHEACIKMLKHTLKHMTKGGPLAMDEFDLVLSKAANAINDRPLSVRKHGGAEDEFCPIESVDLCRVLGHVEYEFIIVLSFV